MLPVSQGADVKDRDTAMNSISLLILIHAIIYSACRPIQLYDILNFLLQEKQPFERIEVSRAQALEMFAENKFKASCLSQISVYSSYFFVLVIIYQYPAWI